MRLVIQRVRQASVVSDGELTGEIGVGLMVLVGFGQDDKEDLPGSKVWTTMLNKMLDLRIFSDEQDKMNLSVRDVDGGLLLVSQFTLYASCKKGRRPSFTGACEPGLAARLYDRFVTDVGAVFSGKIGCGVFGADMDVTFTNWGPVTIILDSDDFV